MGLGRLIIVAALFLLLYLLWRRFTHLPPEQVSRFLKRCALAALIGMLLLLAFTGHLNWIFAAIGAAAGALFSFARRLIRMPWILSLAQRLFHQYRANKSGIGAGQGPVSRIQTRHLRMFLNQSTGEMGGEVIAGALAGYHLHDLELGQLVSLWREYRTKDRDSAALMEAYLDRTRGRQWRDREAGSGPSASPADGDMAPQEAYAVLGLEEGAGKDEIVAAHRRLVQKLHPDRGGSTYLAAKINRAKEVLLKE